jgi:hypothetical protein
MTDYMLLCPRRWTLYWKQPCNRVNLHKVRIVNRIDCACCCIAVVDNWAIVAKQRACMLQYFVSQFVNSEEYVHVSCSSQEMASLVLVVASLCKLLPSVSPSGRSADLELQESRNHLSDARVKSIQDILLLRDSYVPNTSHSPDSNLATRDHKTRQDVSTTAYRPEHPRIDPSRFRAQPTGGYEIYEEPDVPSTNAERSPFQGYSTGKTRLSSLAVAEGKSTVHQIDRRKPTGLAVPEGSSQYPHVIVRPQGDLRNHRTELSAPTELRGNSQLSVGQNLQTLPLLACTDATGHASLCHSFCCAPLRPFS